MFGHHLCPQRFDEDIRDPPFQVVVAVAASRREAMSPTFGCDPTHALHHGERGANAATVEQFIGVGVAAAPADASRVGLPETASGRGQGSWQPGHERDRQPPRVNRICAGGQAELVHRERPSRERSGTSAHPHEIGTRDRGVHRPRRRARTGATPSAAPRDSHQRQRDDAAPGRRHAAVSRRLDGAAARRRLSPARPKPRSRQLGQRFGAVHQPRERTAARSGWLRPPAR